MSRLNPLDGQHDLQDIILLDSPEPTSPMSFTATAGVSVSATMPATLYLTETGDTTAISIHDIHQGQLGDCFLLSSMGEIAMISPQTISGMITQNTNGTETVRLFVDSRTGRPISFNSSGAKQVSVTVDNNFSSQSVNNGSTQDVVNGTKEIWTQVLEKAVATLGGGYNSIANGGSPIIAMEELTGKQAFGIAPASLTYAQLTSFMSSKDLIVFDTKASGALSNNLVNNHAYMFEGLSGTGANAMVTLGNPWGFNQPTQIALSSLSKNFSEIDVGHV